MSDPAPVADLIDLRGAIVDALRAGLPAGVGVDTHGGDYDEDAIKRYSALAPCVRVALVGTGRGERFPDGRWEVPAQFSVACFALDAPAGDRASIVGRDAAAAALATAVTLIVEGNRFARSGVGQPEEVAGRNEYSGKIDTLGVAIWQVVWTQRARLGPVADPENMTPDAVIAALASVIVAPSTQIFDASIDGVAS